MLPAPPFDRRTGHRDAGGSSRSFPSARPTLVQRNHLEPKIVTGRCRLFLPHAEERVLKVPVGAFSRCRSATRANLPARLLEEYDNVTFLVSRLGMPMSLGNLVQGIASIDHRP